MNNILHNKYFLIDINRGKIFELATHCFYLEGGEHF